VFLHESNIALRGDAASQVDANELTRPELLVEVEVTAAKIV